MKSNSPSKTSAFAPWYLPTHIAMGTLFVVAQLPSSVLRACGQILATFARPFAARRISIIRANIALCFPANDPATQEQLVQANYRATIMALLQSAQAILRLRALPKAQYQIAGLEHLRAALQLGQGAVVYSAHYLPMLFAGRALCEALGQPVHQLVRHHNNPAIEAWIDWGRRRVCTKTIGKKELPDLIRSTRAGHAVAMVCDQNFSYRMAFLPFFGQPAATLTIIPKLLRSSKATLVPLHCWIDAVGIVQIHIDAPLADFPSALEAHKSSAAADVHDTGRLVNLVEHAVRQHPEQYLWAHRRFKTRPDGKDAIY